MRVQNQMLVLRVMAAGLLIAGALFTVSPAAADDGETCTNSSDDVAIAACTRAIASGQYTTQNVAAFYTSRGIAYGAKGQHDRAIQDFDQAIRLDPQFAPGDRTDPVAVGAGRFIFCCRAILFDCRTRVTWAIRNIQENSKHCVETCLRNVKC
jgi:tetratricopeptide (TPR) repeat protein